MHDKGEPRNFSKIVAQAESRNGNEEPPKIPQFAFSGLYPWLSIALR